MKLPITITRVHPDAKIPTYATPGAVGFDIPLIEDVTIPAHQFIKVRTGLVFCVPEGYGLFIFARSSTFGKTGLKLTNSVGVIDQDYCGPEDELHVSLHNQTDADVVLQKGMRLAQGVFLPVGIADFIEGAPKQNISRGGFGTTGA